MGKGRGGAVGGSDTVSFATGAGCFGNPADSTDLAGGAASAAAGVAAGFLLSFVRDGAAIAPPPDSFCVSVKP